jgi:type I restriction enzyme S subunit
MEEWKEYRLGDIIKISSGFAYKGEYLGYGDKYLLGMGCVSFNEQFLDKGVRPYSGECDNRFYAKAGDIVLATRQQSDNMPILGMPAVIPYKYKDRKLIVGANLYRIINESKDFGNDFIYWLLKDPRYVNYIKSCQSGTTVRMITKANIENYTFVCPNKKSRLLISRFLWTLEKKIELNRRINENLEQQTQALFKSWFVDFEPFKDGKFVDSELGMIPEGWKVKKLGELCDSISVTHPCKEGQLIFLNTGDIENGFVLNHKYMNIKDMPGQAKKSIQENDILYSEIRPINRHFAFVNFAAQEYIVSTKLMVLRANDNESSIRLYQYLTSEDVINELQHEAESRSGTFPQIRFENIKSLKILIGSDDVEKQYTKYIENIYKMIFQYRKEIIRLEQLRDTLLPRLMSGELEIKDNSYD